MRNNIQQLREWLGSELPKKKLVKETTFYIDNKPAVFSRKEQKLILK